MHYRKEIDGLRALAVIPVVLFHAGFDVISGGYVGVDIFFVISGYLISSIILEDKVAGAFCLVKFYERRVRRIFPALFVVVAVCIPIGWLLLLPGDVHDFSRSVVALVIFSTNIFFWFDTDYFTTAAELKPLLHTWSLAVEEQFYVLFPLLIITSWSLGRRWVLVILSFIGLVSLVVADWGAYNKPVATYFLLPTRAWELVLGSLGAFFHFRRRNAVCNPLEAQLISSIGFIAMVYAIFVFDKYTPFPSFYALVPTIGALMVILYASDQTLVGGILGSKLFVSIGLISYSLYLWHQPLLAYSKYTSIEEPSHILTCGLLALTLGIAYLSWRYVETPFRNSAVFGRGIVFSYSAICGMLLMALGLFGGWHQGFAGKLSMEQLVVLEYSKYKISDIYRQGTCFLALDHRFSGFSESCKAKLSSPDQIWGDSHAAALSVGLRKHFGDIVQYTAASCPPVVGYLPGTSVICKDVNSYVFKEIESNQPRRLFLHANWLAYKKGDIADELRKTITQVRILSPTTLIVVVGVVPQWSPTLLKLMARNNVSLDAEHMLATSMLGELELVNKSIRNVSEREGVEFVSPLDALCKAEKCLATVSYENKIVPMAWDYGHLTEPGAVYLVNKLFTE